MCTSSGRLQRCRKSECDVKIFLPFQTFLALQADLTILSIRLMPRMLQKPDTSAQQREIADKRGNFVLTSLQLCVKFEYKLCLVKAE